MNPWEPIPDRRPAARKKVAEAAKPILDEIRNLGQIFQVLAGEGELPLDTVNALEDEYAHGAPLGYTIWGVSAPHRVASLPMVIEDWREAIDEATRLCDQCDQTATHQRLGEKTSIDVFRLEDLACGEHAK